MARDRMSDKELYLHEFRHTVNTCCRAAESASHIDVVRDVMSNLAELNTSLGYAERGELISADDSRELATALRSLLRSIATKGEEIQSLPGNSIHFRSFRVPSEGRRGASRYNISVEQLKFLVLCRFTKKKIAEIFHVSTKTIHRRMKQMGLNHQGYTDMTDEELDQHISSLTMGNRNIGSSSVATRLQNNGLRVQRERVRQAMRRVDPAGVALRSRRVLKRRVYNVGGPNCLWHLDGNHKLIRWRIVVHAGVDGFSRLVTFMKAADNNRSSTVLGVFREAIEQYGTPSRIRCDNGGEFTSVCNFMDELYGPGRGSAIRGRSVHNQRIERTWRDMWNGSINTFYDLFSAMERDNILDPNSEEQIFALLFVYLPRIQHSLNIFQQQWNHHKLRTEHHQSPYQLYVKRSLELLNGISTATRNIFHSTDQFESVADVLLNENEVEEDGDEVEEDGDEVADNNLSYVHVPSTLAPITQDQLQVITEQIDPLEGIDSLNLGIDIYMKVLDKIGEMLLV